MWHFLAGLLIAAVWGAIIYFSPRATEFFGRIQRAEEHLWGTRNAFVLLGFIVIVLWVLFMFGIVQSWSKITQI
jgi:hypothetical protein